MTKSTKLKLSVVIPAFNEEESLPKVIKALKKQTFKDTFEIIVVDNNSIDKTASVAKKLGAKVVFEPRKGTRFAYDAGMRAATGEIIAVTNADVKLPKNWLSTLLKYYEDPEVVGVGTHIDFYNCPKYVNFIWYVIKELGDIALKTGLLEVKERTFWGPSMSCRRDVFYKVGGINQGSDTNEDYIFTQLIRKHGKAPYVYDTTVLIDGRRYAGGLLNAISNWANGIGLNSLSLMFRKKSVIKNFKDVRR